jgi:hypothetical protein
MASKKLQDMSREELLRAEKTLKLVTYLLAAVLFCAFVFNVFAAFKKGFSVLMVVPITLLPIVMVNLGTLSRIRKELQLRK